MHWWEQAFYGYLKQIIFNRLNDAYYLTMVKSRKEHPSTVFYYGRNGLSAHLQIYLICAKVLFPTCYSHLTGAGPSC